MKRKKVWLLCGIPGSGKSTWVENQLKTHSGVWCSRDVVRFSLLAQGEDYFSREQEVFEAWIEAINKLIADKHTENIYIDATHISPASRKKVLNKLPWWAVDIYAVNFLIPVEECIRRNALREGLERVPESIIRNFHKKFIPANENEKWNYVEIINVKE